MLVFITIFALQHLDSPVQSAVAIVSPDMLYKLSKKIAQLTKVIYSLNTRNDDLECDLESMRLGYEERLQLCQQQLHVASNNLMELSGKTKFPSNIRTSSLYIHTSKVLPKMVKNA